MKIVLILASTVMLASAQYFDQIAMESGGETSPQYTYATPVQQQQVVYQQPQQVYYSPAQQTYTVPLQAQAYVAPPTQILSQQNYISQSETPTVVNIPTQVQQFSQYVSSPVVQATYSAPESQVVKVAPVVSQATYVSPLETYNAQPQPQPQPQPTIVRLRENNIVRLRENFVAPQNNQVDHYVNENVDGYKYAAPAPAPAPVVNVAESYSAPPIPLTKVVRNQIFAKQPITVLKEVSESYGAPEKPSSGDSSPSPGFTSTQIKSENLVAGYGPPGYTPPAVIETYIPTAKMTDSYYNSNPNPNETILKISQPEQPQTYYNSPPDLGDNILKISQSLLSEEPVQSYGPPEETRQLYGVPEEPKEHKHIYVHTAPQQEYSPKVRILQPVNQQPEKHYQIIFVRAPNPQVPVRTEIQLPPQAIQKTLVYVLTKAPESNHEVKISAPVPTKPSAPEVYFIRYAANAPSGGYGAPSVVPVPTGNFVKQPTKVSYSSPRNLDVYAPDMSYSSYSTNSGGYHKRDTDAVKEDKSQSQSVSDVKDAVAETNESKSSAE